MGPGLRSLSLARGWIGFLEFSGFGGSCRCTEKCRLQFGTFMNVYFLIIACLQLIAILAPVSPSMTSFLGLGLISAIVTIWVPLIFIFAVSATKEALDDISRAKADEKANSRKYYVYENGVKVQKRSEELRVGDIVWLQVSYDLTTLAITNFHEGKRRNSMRHICSKVFRTQWCMLHTDSKFGWRNRLETSSCFTLLPGKGRTRTR